MLQLEDLPDLDCLLITQGYDDHCHEKTLGPLSRLMPNLRVVASPNARGILSKYFKNVLVYFCVPSVFPFTGFVLCVFASSGDI